MPWLMSKYSKYLVVALARIEYFPLLLFHQLKISKFNALFHWRIVFSIPTSLWSTQHSDIGSDTNKKLLLPYPYSHLLFGYGYGYEYWRMWKNDIRIRIGGGYPRIIRIRWHLYTQPIRPYCLSSFLFTQIKNEW